MFVGTHGYSAPKRKIRRSPELDVETFVKHPLMEEQLGDS
jgi:hypothetical protein